MRAASERTRRFVARKHYRSLRWYVSSFELLPDSTRTFSTHAARSTVQVTRNKSLTFVGRVQLTRDLAKASCQSILERTTMRLSFERHGLPTNTVSRNSLVSFVVDHISRYLILTKEIFSFRSLCSHFPRILHWSCNSRSRPLTYRMGDSQERYLPLESHDSHRSNLRSRQHQRSNR